MAHNNILPRNAGFTLIELSVVLIILGLLTGGIMGGRSLIKAAQLRSVSEEYVQYRTAANGFKDIYNSQPGDMADATDYWTGTWNGNGDGAIDDATAASATGEIFTFWQHLSKAGMISGEFTGIGGSGGSGPYYMDSLPGENVPVSKFPNSGWSVYWVPAGSVYTVDWYDMAYENTFEFGGKITGYEMGNPVLTPEEAWGIDSKFDDGEPGKGSIIARYWDDACADATNATDFDSSYKRSDSSVQCALAFRDSF